MLVQSMPYPAGLAGLVAGDFATVVKSASQAVSNNKVTWETLVHGTAAAFDNANDELQTNAIALCRVRANFQGGALAPTIAKNGSASYDGKAAGYCAPHGGTGSKEILFTAIQSVGASDAFDVFGGNSATLTAIGNNWFGIEVLRSAARYCISAKSSDQAIAVDTVTSVTFNGTDVYDPEEMHDPSSNSHLHVVPAGGGYVRYRTQIKMASSGGSGEGWLFTRYATTAGGALNPVAGGFYHQTERANVDHFMAGATAILTCSGGEVFATGVLSGSGATGTVRGTQDTWAELEILDPAVKFTFLQGATNASVAAAGRRPFPTTVTNTAGASLTGDGGVIVPSGFTKARLTFNVLGPTDNNPFDAWGSLNGTYISGLPWVGSNTQFGDSANGDGNWVPVAAGDVIDVRVSAGFTVAFGGGFETWMCVEFG